MAASLAAARRCNTRLLHPHNAGHFDLDFSNANLQEFGWLAMGAITNNTIALDDARMGLTELRIHTHFVGSEQANTGRYMKGETPGYTGWRRRAKSQRAEVQGIALTAAPSAYLGQVDLMKGFMKKMHTQRMQAMSNFISDALMTKMANFFQHTVAVPAGYQPTPVTKVVEVFDDITHLKGGQFITTQPLAVDWVILNIMTPNAINLTHVDCQLYTDFSMPAGFLHMLVPTPAALTAFVTNLETLKLHVGGVIYRQGYSTGMQFADEGYVIATRNQINQYLSQAPVVAEYLFLPIVIRRSLGSGWLRTFELTSTKAMPNFEQFYLPRQDIGPFFPPFINGLQRLKLENFTIDNLNLFYTFLHTMPSLLEIHLVNIQTWDRYCTHPWVPFMSIEQFMSLFAGPRLAGLTELNIRNLTIRTTDEHAPFDWIRWDPSAIQPIGYIVAGGTHTTQPFTSPIASPVHAQIQLRFAGNTGGVILPVPAVPYFAGVNAVLAPAYVPPVPAIEHKLAEPARPRYWFH